MIIDGEKWACEACVRGHRVSNCQHSDRPLQHINKKGRPVSQCQHCRSMRKSRASHVKCDCGEKSHKCAHLQTSLEGHRDSCCCNHGGRCTCSHKKEPPQLEVVPESDSDEQEARSSSKASSTKSSSGGHTHHGAGGGGVRSRRRANTIHSDGMLTFDENGRHKPTYKHAKASSKVEPYPLRRVNSMHSASSLGSDAGGRGASSSSRTATGAKTSSSSSRRVKSETASPLMASGGGAATSSSSPGGFAQLNGQLPPLDLSSIEYPRYVANNTFDLFGSSGGGGGGGGISDHEAPMFSAGLSAASVDWSHYDPAGFVSSASAARSYGGSAFTDFGGASEQAPTLTTTTSGDVSEVEDFMGPGGQDDYDYDRFGLPTSAAAAAASGLSLDYDDFNKLPKDPTLAAAAAAAAAVSAAVPGSAAVVGAAFADDPVFWMSDYGSHTGLPSLSETTADPSVLYWDPA